MPWHHKRHQLIIILCILVLLFSPAIILGAESQGRVRIAASENGFYDWQNQLFKAWGDVAVTSDELLIQGDFLIFDLDAGEVWIEGNVSLLQNEQKLLGESLLYNIETGQGTFNWARAEIPLEKDTGSIYLLGTSIEIDDEKFLVNSGKFTTCDLEESHYHLATKELEYYPDKKIVIRGVTYYEGKIPLFYWPYLVVPLDLDGKYDFFNLPSFGYSEIEGYYMKNTFNYYFNSRANGNVYLDLFTRLGIGIGARHYYELKSFGKGSLYLYGIPTSSSPVIKSSFSHELTREKWNFTTNTNYENSWARYELRTQNRLKLSLAKTNAETWFDYRENPAATVKKQKELGFKWTQNLADNWRFNLQGKLLERSKDEEKLRTIDYLAESVYRKDRHTLTIAAQQQYNPDLLEGQNPGWRSVQRIPELKWDVSDWGFLPLRTQLIVGRYGEQPSTITMNRIYGQLTLNQRSFRPTSSTTINYQANVGTAAYSNNQRQFWLYNRLGLTQKLTANLQFSSSYTRRDVWGLTPFRFDRQSPVQNLDLRLNYSTSPWRLSLATNYNFLTKRFGAATLQANWRPNQAWNLNTYAYYDLNQKAFTRVVPMVTYKKDPVELSFGARYRVTDKVIERLDGRIALPVGSFLKLSYDSIYEPPKGAFTTGNIAITADLHCRTLTLSYDLVQKRVALQFTINAFPTLPIGWDSAGGISLFDLDEIVDIIGAKE